MRLIVIFLFISSVCFGQFVRDTDGAYVKWNDMYLVGTQGIIPNPPDPPDPPDPVIPGNFEGIVLYDIDFSEQGSPPYVNSNTTARAFFPGIAADHFWRFDGGILSTNPEVDSIVLLNGDPCWRITIIDEGEGETSYGIGWVVYMEGANFNNMQVDFDLLLSADWDMLDCSTGGKLPGFGAGDSIGGYPPSGGSYQGFPGEGYSVRGGYGINSEIGTYNYLAQMTPGSSGLSYYPFSTNGNGPFVYATETWYHITYRAKQNRIGYYDGTIEMLLNGVSVMLMSSSTRYGLKFREKSEINMDYVFAEVFAGGGVNECFEGMSAWIDNLVYSVPDYNGEIGIGNTIGDENIPYSHIR